MNATQLLAHYEMIIEAPDAVASLRRFILDLAIRGKLVPQEPKEEPASDLLIRIANEKQRRIENGEGKAGRGTRELLEAPFAIPRSWLWSQLATIGLVSPHNEASDTLEASFVPMTSIAAEYGVAHKHEVRPWGQIKKGYTHFAEGDVGLAKITPCFENRKSTVFRNLAGGIGSGTTELHIVRPLLVAADYVLLYLKSPYFVDNGVPKMTGTAGQKRLPAEYFSQAPFPLPPVAEQHRIVAKVAELMMLCDRLESARTEQEASRDRLAKSSLVRLSGLDSEVFQADARFVLKALPAITARSDQLKPFREMILNLAVRGKLIPQDRYDEAGPVLLSRLKKALTEMNNLNGIRVRPPVPTLERSEVWFTFPESWALPSFDEIFAIASGVTKGQRVSPEDSVDVPYLRVANVQRGHLDLSVIKNITVKKVDRTRYALRAGDILMTEGGDWDKLGRAAIWREEIPGCIHQNHIFRVRPPSSDILPEWVVIFVNSPLGRDFFENASKQTTNLASINMTQLRGCPLPLPPIAEQRRIAAKVAELMAVCDQLEQALGRSQSTRQRLLEAVLHEAIEHLDNSSSNDLRRANDCVRATG